MARLGSWIEVFPEGVYVRPAGAWIDPSEPKAKALVTHGHGDHARGGHGAVLATRETLAIMEVRYGPQSGQGIAYSEQVRVGDVDVSFVPAGHVLGSAQIVVELLVGFLAEYMIRDARVEKLYYDLLTPYTGHIDIEIMTASGAFVCDAPYRAYDAVGPVLVMEIEHACVIPVSQPLRTQTLYARLRWATEQEWMISYVRTRARGDKSRRYSIPVSVRTSLPRAPARRWRTGPPRRRRQKNRRPGSSSSPATTSTTPRSCGPATATSSPAPCHPNENSRAVV